MKDRTKALVLKRDKGSDKLLELATSKDTTASEKYGCVFLWFLDAHSKGGNE